MPIYFTFEAQPTTSTEFAWIYFINFLQQYVAFRLKDDELARRESKVVDVDGLLALAESLSEDPIAHFADRTLRILRSPIVLLHHKLEAAIHLPRQVMEYNRARFLPETPIFVMLDEFQDVLRLKRRQTSRHGGVVPMGGRRAQMPPYRHRFGGATDHAIGGHGARI